MASPVKTFGDLPNEVVELIFSSVPLMDLLRVCSLVCNRWKNIIWRPGFIPWKKAYHRYKILPNERDFSEEDSTERGAKKPRLDADKEESFWRHWQLFEDLKDDKFVFTNDWIKAESLLSLPDEFTKLDDSLELLLPSLVNFAAKKFGMASKKFVQISRHPKASRVKSWLATTMPEVVNVDVGVVVILCAIAEDAFDVQAILEALVSPSISTTCPSLDASELLYFIALVFLRFNRTLGLPHRFHFNVFQAIYFYESSFEIGTGGLKPSSGSPRKGQQSLTSFGFVRKESSIRLTAEQFRIINHPLDPKTDDVIKIVAFAGTGKTTTLINLCKENPNLRFLVVMYNRSVKEHAQFIFPTNNVKCYTAHSIAFQKCGFMFKNKLTSNLKPMDIIESDILSESVQDKKDKTSIQKRAAQVLKTIENFMNSADLQLEDEHVPGFWFDAQKQTDVGIGAQEQDWILENSKRVWEAMNDQYNLKLRIPHDGYLKAYQLRRPDLQRVWPHDVLLIDEAQDMNPAMLDIFAQQKTPKVLVGDPNQQIYLFRGAVNALGSVESTQTFYLTQSFRFGPEIAFAADAFLTKYKKVHKQTLVGGLKRDFVVSRSAINVKDKEFRPVAVVGRTNIGLLAEVVKLVCDVDESKRPCAAFAGGLQSYNFDDYLGPRQ